MEFLFLTLKAIPPLFSCFFGLKLQQLVLAITWFLLGYSLGQHIFESIASGPILMIFAFALGLVCAACSFRFQMICLFLVYFVSSCYLLIMLQMVPLEWYNLLLYILVSLLIGYLGVKFYKPMWIIATSISGAYGISNLLLSYFHIMNTSLLIGATILLGVGGILFQWKSNHPKFT